MRKANPADKICAQKCKEDYPKAQEHLTVQNMPSVGQVGHREELQREGQLHESQAHLDAIHPVPALGNTLQPSGKKSKEREGKSQGKGKAKHSHSGTQESSTRAHFHQEESYDGTCTREADQAECEGHEENAQQAMCGF